MSPTTETGRKLLRNLAPFEDREGIGAGIRAIENEARGEESASVGAIDRRVLVTMHYPLSMSCVAAVLKAVAGSYPDAVVAENGEVWDKPVVQGTTWSITTRAAALSGNPETESER